MDAADKDATIEYLLGHIKAQETVIAALQQELAESKALIKLQAFEIARLKRVVFGPRGERVSPDQHSLPGIEVADNDPPQAPAKPVRVKEHDRTTRRPPLTLDPERVTDTHTYLDPEQTHCPCCGDELAMIGEETSVRVERERPRYLRTTTHRRQKACSRCKGAGVLIAPAQEPPSTGAGMVGASLAVDIATMHFADHLPYNRMEGIFAREGLHIDRSTLSRVGSRVAAALRKVVTAMKDELLASREVVGIDGTGVKILASPHCKRRVVYVLHGLGHVVYRALESESADCVLEGFAGFRGVVLSDAAKVHVGSVSQALGLTIALCGAHARRKFFDARETDTARAKYALAFYQEVARREREWKELDAATRQRERENVLRPRFQEFWEWLRREKPNLLPRSPMLEAFNYVENHWEGLCRFLSDGRVEWTNNASERLLRHVVVGRKAWVFRGSFEGAEDACVLWSLMQNCRALGIDPRRYLIDTLEALTETPHSGLLSLTPRAYAKRLRRSETAA